MLWVIGIIIYLAVGQLFSMPTGFKWTTKIFMSLFWLPIMLFVMVVVRMSGGRLL